MDDSTGEEYSIWASWSRLRPAGWLRQIRDWLVLSLDFLHCPTHRFPGHRGNSLHRLPDLLIRRRRQRSQVVTIRGDDYDGPFPWLLSHDRAQALRIRMPEVFKRVEDRI